MVCSASKLPLKFVSMNGMNGYTQHAVLDEDAFGEAKGMSVKAFDAFRKIELCHCRI